MDFDPRDYDEAREDERWGYDRDRDDPERDRDDPRDPFVDSLDLPRGLERELVQDDRENLYELNREDSLTLATIGAFRVAAERDLEAVQGLGSGSHHDTLEHLRDEGLIRFVAINESERAVVITEDGRAVLDARTPFSGRWKEWLETVRTRAASPATPADGLGTALRAAAGGSMYLIPYALFGVVLSRGRGWTVLFRTGALIVTSIGANLVAFVLTTIILRELSPDYQTARAFAATLFVALMWLFGARIAAATIQAWREVARFAVPVRFD